MLPMTIVPVPPVVPYLPGPVEVHLHQGTLWKDFVRLPDGRWVYLPEIRPKKVPRD